jgi:cell wall-associated NlpC family hydrolase
VTNPIAQSSTLNPQSPFSPASVPTSLNDKRQNATFPTLNPPKMNTMVYAPDVNILIAHNAQTMDVSKDIVRGEVQRKENSASSLFFTLANPELRYTSGSISRMDRIACFLTRTNKLQVFSGYLDTIPWMQAYPGTVDFRATCTIKRLLHTWWNPALPSSQNLFDQIGNSTNQSDSGIGTILQNILIQVGKWDPSQIHIQNFPPEFLTFLNNYMVTSNMTANNAAIGQAYTALILGSDQSPGPMSAVGYQAGDPVGTPITAANANSAFYLAQIVQAVDARGMGPNVNTTADTQTVQQTATGLVGSRDQSVQEAGQQLTQYATNQQLQNSASDAAILAFACCMVESGGGTPELLMYANNQDPDSLSYYHDQLSTNGSSEGLFQQQATGNWGTTAQRMNPYSSAGMFLDKLQSVTGWRNMDPGQAIQAVQNGAATNVGLYDTAVLEASKMVQAYRAAQTGASTAANVITAQIPGFSSLTTGLGGGVNPTSSVMNTAMGVATTSPNMPGAVDTVTGKPNPDSEGAINAAMVYIATPYSQTLGGGNTPGVGLDCSGMVQAAFRSIGQQIPRNTGQQLAGLEKIPLAAAGRGDILQTRGGGHTGIYLGGGMWVQTGGPPGVPGHVEAINPLQAYAALHVCNNGGVDSLAAWQPSSTMGPGSVPGTGSGGQIGTGGDASGQEPIARNLFTYMFSPTNYASSFADFTTGEKAYIDDQPLIQVVSAMAGASLRNFQSSPTGDLLFYYPDPFGMDGKPTIFNLEDIELTDCHIDLSDDALTTHVYVDGDLQMLGEADSALGWLTTSGVATVENDWLYRRLITAAPGDVDSSLTAQQLMNRFGVRPYRQTYQVAGNADLEFLLACKIFMGKWAAQYTTNLGLTFLPELYPGYRISLVGHNLSVYVGAVTHVFDWERGFRTMATVSAAGNPNANTTIFSSMPGFLNPVQSAPDASNRTTTGSRQTGPGFANPLAGSLLDGTLSGDNSGAGGLRPFTTVSPIE